MLQTFNLVPSLVLLDTHRLDCAIKPAHDLSEAERKFVLRYFFQADAGQPNLPRSSLCRVVRSQAGAPKFGTQDIRDLRVHSQLAWF